MASDRERDAAGNAGTGTPGSAGSAGKADQIALKFFTKAALLVHHARATPPAGPHPPVRLDKWFNLETPDTDAFREHLRLYRSLSAAAAPAAPALPPLELHVLLSVPELATNQVLVLSDPAAPRARVDPTPRLVLLESWHVQFAPAPHRDARDAPHADVALSTVYKQGISVFRSMFTLLRVLPAW
ncbi:autophagy-related protein 13, partial [Gautieria morchelliformis]